MGAKITKKKLFHKNATEWIKIIHAIELIFIPLENYAIYTQTHDIINF